MDGSWDDRGWDDGGWEPPSTLEEKLRVMKKQYEDLHSLAKDTDAFKGDVNIQGDKDIPYKIMKRILFSCNTAGYNNLNFAVTSIGNGKQGEEKTSALTK